MISSWASLPSSSAIATDIPFWPTLWPSLAATVAGVAIGLPLGLWLNRIALRSTRAAEEKERRETLSRVVHVLRACIAANGSAARTLAGAIEMHSRFLDKGEPIDFSHLNVATWLETERWEVMRDEFVRTADDPELQGRVALFFHDVREAANLVNRRYELASGPQGGTEFARDLDGLLRHLLGISLPSIAEEATALDALLRPLDRTASQAS